MVVRRQGAAADQAAVAATNDEGRGVAHPRPVPVRQAAALQHNLFNWYFGSGTICGAKKRFPTSSTTAEPTAPMTTGRQPGSHDRTGFASVATPADCSVVCNGWPRFDPVPGSLSLPSADQGTAPAVVPGWVDLASMRLGVGATTTMLGATAAVDRCVKNGTRAFATSRGV